ncbi:MAG: hypothetical protein LBD94_02750 [Rickettsiales bacterium]|jgi:cation:H+ antiporter|nr:hypothetical protein [Rickettsiales bacterium]
MMWLFLAFGIAMMSMGADWMVGGCSRLSRALHISAFVISALVIGVGGNLPEILITLLSVGTDMESSILPIIVSSNIINILGIVGIFAVVSPIYINTVSKREVRILLMSTALMAIMLYDGRLDFAEGIGLFAIFIYYLMGAKPRASRYDVIAMKDWWRTAALLVFGIGFLYCGSEIFMNGLNQIVTRFHLDGSAAGSLIIAPGTSGPEIIVSILSIIRKRPAILIGNMVGSCVSHIILVGAIAGVIAEPTTESFDVVLMLLATIIFCIDIVERKKITRWNGLLYLSLLCLYFLTIML